MSDYPTDLIPASGQDNFITRLAEAIGSKANAATVFAEPISSQGATIVPVARARWGCGGGETHQGLGGGGGMMVDPVGYLVIRDGEVEYREINGTLRLLTAVIAGIFVGAFFLRRRLL
jgi:uncharacterized spore protein YtfJ